MNIYEVVFEVWHGETHTFLAENFDEAVAKAKAWINKQATKNQSKEIKSIQLYGVVDA